MAYSENYIHLRNGIVLEAVEVKGDHPCRFCVFNFVKHKCPNALYDPVIDLKPPVSCYPAYREDKKNVCWRIMKNEN